MRRNLLFFADLFILIILLSALSSNSFVQTINIKEQTQNEA